jgi:hypothetical protein
VRSARRSFNATVPDRLARERPAQTATSAFPAPTPHVGLSVAISMISRRSSGAVDGRPRVRVGWVQWRATRRRCQRNSVSGVTSHPWRWGRGSAWAIAAGSDRSSSVTCRRCVVRLSTASWWRSTMISRSSERPDRTASRASEARNRYKMRHTYTSIARNDARHRPRPQYWAPTTSVGAGIASSSH